MSEHLHEWLIAGNGTYLICPPCGATKEVSCVMDDAGFCFVHWGYCDHVSVT